MKLVCLIFRHVQQTYPVWRSELQKRFRVSGMLFIKNSAV